MPSDDPVPQVLASLLPAFEPWRSAVVATEEELRGLLGRPTAPRDAGVALGAFARGRIDLDRFSGLVTKSQPVDEAALVRLRVAYDTLTDLASRPREKMLVAAAEPGERLRSVVARALAEVGRAFGAAHEASLARQGAWRESEHAGLHQSYPFHLWSRRERRLAPPLVIEVDGADIAACEVTEFLDGNVRLALIVRGPCPPAALARLITPGTFVQQTNDPKAMARLAAWDGPGVAALVPDGAALFVHDPAGGRSPWERLRIERMPQESPRRTSGRWSPEQQAEDLRQLAALAMRPSAAAVAAGAAALTADEAAAANADPAGRLAAWLLDASGAGAV